MGLLETPLANLPADTQAAPCYAAWLNSGAQDLKVEATACPTLQQELILPICNAEDVMLEIRIEWKFCQTAIVLLQTL